MSLDKILQNIKLVQEQLQHLELGYKALVPAGTALDSPDYKALPILEKIKQLSAVLEPFKNLAVAEPAQSAAEKKEARENFSAALKSLYPKYVAFGNINYARLHKVQSIEAFQQWLKTTQGLLLLRIQARALDSLQVLMLSQQLSIASSLPLDKFSEAHAKIVFFSESLLNMGSSSDFFLGHNLLLTMEPEERSRLLSGQELRLSPSSFLLAHGESLPNLTFPLVVEDPKGTSEINLTMLRSLAKAPLTGGADDADQIFAPPSLFQRRATTPRRKSQGHTFLSGAGYVAPVVDGGVDLGIVESEFARLYRRIEAVEQELRQQPPRTPNRPRSSSNDRSRPRSRSNSRGYNSRGASLYGRGDEVAATNETVTV